MISGAIANVKDYGALGTGVDDSVAIQKAFDSGLPVYFPSGTFSFNANINNKVVVSGNGSHASIIKPYNTALPILLYTPATISTPSPAVGWTYHSEIRNIGFEGILTAGVPTGIGFAFGAPTPSIYVSNAEFVNNVSFHNCFFQYLNKGVMFPFGNIGSQFYACGFQSNFYGIYSKSNNSGSGSIMHAGNKYFYNGEFSGNTCGAYFDNAVDGFGGVGFTDTIFEANINAVYINNQVPYGVYLPPIFTNCWSEINGVNCPTLGDAVVDTWIAGVQGSINIGRYPFYFNERQITFNGGVVNGVNLASANSTINIKNARVECAGGFGGQPSSVSSANSSIQFENCFSASGFDDVNQQCINVGVNHVLYPNVTDVYYSSSRAMYIPVSYNKSASTSLAGAAYDLTSAINYTGSSSGIGVVVAAGTKFATCNQFSVTFTAQNELVYLAAFNTSLSGAKWYAATVDVLCASGYVQISVGDTGANQMGIKAVAPTIRWTTLAYIGYFPNSITALLAIQPYGLAGVGVNVLQISNYQIRQFDTQVQAELFIAQNTFAA